MDSVHRAVEQGGRGERLGADIEQVREVVMVMMVVMIMLRVVSRSVNELLLHSIEMFPDNIFDHLLGNNSSTCPGQRGWSCPAAW